MDQAGSCYCWDQEYYNAIITLNGAVKIHQQQSRHDKGAQGTYRFTVQYEADQISAGATQYTMNDAEGRTIFLAEIHIDLKNGSTPSAEPSVERKPFRMQRYASPYEFPLAQSYSQFTKIKFVITNCNHIRGWDLDAVFFFLRGNRGYHEDTDDRA